MEDENGVVLPDDTEEQEQPEYEQEESIEEIKARLAKAEEVAQNQKIRAEKAEAEAKAKKEPVRTGNLTLNAGDLMAIKNADIDPEGMDIVEKYARDNNLSLREAIAHPHVKAILSVEKELKTTAIAANVEGVRRGTIKVSDDTLLKNADAGKLPDADDDIERLVAARFKRQ